MCLLKYEFLARIQQSDALLSVSCPEIHDVENSLHIGGADLPPLPNRLGKVTIFPTSLNTYPGLGRAGAGGGWNAVLNLKLPC